MPEESGILGLGIRNTAQRIRNPSKTKFHLQRLESSSWNPESMADLDSLSLGERVISNMISMFVFFGKNFLLHKVFSARGAEKK